MFIKFNDILLNTNAIDHLITSDHETDCDTDKPLKKPKYYILLHRSNYEEGKSFYMRAIFFDKSKRDKKFAELEKKLIGEI